jgi:hypothetical protein
MGCCSEFDWVYESGMFIAFIGSRKRAFVVAVVVIAVVMDGDTPKGQFGLLENGTSTVVLKTNPSGEYRESYIIPVGGGGSALMVLLEVAVVVMMLLLLVLAALREEIVGEGEHGCKALITVLLWLLLLLVVVVVVVLVLFAMPRLMI